MHFIAHGHLPTNSVVVRRVVARVAQYIILDGLLYRWSMTQLLLQCLFPEEVECTKREIHEGIARVHQGGKTLAHVALCQGFFWPTMMANITKMVKIYP